MVLVSKLRGSTAVVQNPAAGNSFFNKLRSTFARSASNTALQVCSPTAGDDMQPRVKVTEKLSCVQRFNADQFDDSTSCHSSDSKKSDSPDPFSCYMGNNMVSMADFAIDESVPDNMISVGYGQPAPPVSICGAGDAGTIEECPLDAEPVSPGCAAQTKPNDEALPGTIVGDEPAASSTAEPRSNSKETLETRGRSKESITELPGRLWEHAPPAQTVQEAPRAGGSMAPRAGAAAWDLKKDSKEASRTRFPARLPPLSKVGLGSKKLRRHSGSTPVLEVCNLPEPCGPASPPGRS